MSKVEPLRGYSLEPIFYVYLHKRPTDGSPFYVGKGKGNRAWVSKSRNQHWRNVVNKHGSFVVEIIKENLTEQEAFDFEAETIKSIGIENLTNQTLGGISTTGMVHSEETRRLQSEIALKKLEDNPERLDTLCARLEKLHDMQRNDPEFKSMHSKKLKEYYVNLSEDEKEKVAAIKTAWQKDQEKKRMAVEKLKIAQSSDTARKRASDSAKLWWSSLTDQQRKEKAEQSRKSITSPELREKLLLIRSKKLVINKKLVFNSIKEFLNAINPPEDESYGRKGLLSHPRKVAKEFGFDFFVFKGFYIQDYDAEKHLNLPTWHKGDDLPIPLDFDTLPRSKAIVSDAGDVFLSMQEAAAFCKGKTLEATAGFITKRMKQGKPAMGYFWSVATNQQIAEEVERRLLEQEET